MKDLLWMLYLALTLLFSMATIINIGCIIKDGMKSLSESVVPIITCLLWAIWYIYYLH